MESLEQTMEEARKTLYPRLALFEAITKFRGAPQRREPQGDAVVEARRDFLDAFAYLCDTHKGGATVTAAGLQRLPYSNILWLSANEGIQGRVHKYAEDLRQMLVTMTTENQETVEMEIFRRAVQICTPRLSFYATRLHQYAKKCLMVLRWELPEDSHNDGMRRRILTKHGVLTSLAASFQGVLKNISEPPVFMCLERLVHECYEMRRSQVGAIRERSADAHDDFACLAHYIGRVGATLSSTKAVVRAMNIVPALRDISQIRIIEAPRVRILTMSPEDMIPSEIVRGISQDSQSQIAINIQCALHALVDLDPPSTDGSQSRLRRNLAFRRSITTRVHAELQMIDRFSRHGIQFVDDDRYIGCSKPACYFCYNWLAYHRHAYVLPATHQKVIPCCRAPDSGINEAGAAILKQIYGKMNRQIGQDILELLLNIQQGGEAVFPENRYMSTEGTSCTTRSTISNATNTAYMPL